MRTSARLRRGLCVVAVALTAMAALHQVPPAFAEHGADVIDAECRQGPSFGPGAPAPYPDGPRTLTQGDPLVLRLVYRNEDRSSPVLYNATFTATMQATTFFGPAHVLDTDVRGGGAGLATTNVREIALPTAELPTGTSRILVEVTADVRGGVLARCDLTLTLQAAPALDADADGLLDSWEANGIDLDRDGAVDLALHQPPYGADPRHKDAFLEVDFLPEHRPRDAAVADVIAAFAAAPVDNPDGQQGIDLHVQVDDTFGGHLDNMAVWPEFDLFKELGFGTGAERGAPNAPTVLAAKRLISRYALFAHQYNGGTSSGQAELGGNDLVVTLGAPGWGLNDAGTHTVGTRAAQAGTLMHELGHALGLRHGGTDAVNCKPNYLSVMSYTFQQGIPTGTGIRLDYSRSVLPALVETSLLEPLGIQDGTDFTLWSPDGGIRRLRGRGDGPLNWDGQFPSPDPNAVAVDVNAIGITDCGASPGQTLAGAEDWSRLDFDFRDSAGFADGAHPGVPPELTEPDARAIREAFEAPLAADDAYATDEDRPLAVPAPGVLANDQTPTGSAPTAALLAGPAHGTLALASDGSFTYTPAADFSGTDAFTYRAVAGDGTGATSAPATVTLTVRPVRDVLFASSRSGSGDIYAVEPSGGPAVRLTTAPEPEGEPAWSPDGRRIAFTRTRAGNVDVMVMDANGSHVRRLTTHRATDASPAWSPDGSRIAFSSRRSGGGDVYVMDAADGGHVRRLTTHAAADLQPAWSPDGTRLAFSSTRTGGGDVYTMGADGTAQTRRTTAVGADGEPAWRGTRILFATRRHGPGNTEIYDMDEQGGGERRLTTQPAHDRSPAPSPDGARIAFASNRPGSADFEVLTMAADGSGQVALTNHPAADLSPGW